MAEKDIFAVRKSGLEEEYFRRKEQELVEQLQRRAQMEAERQQMAEASGIADDEILTTLQELGYTRETVELLHLVPLVQVAWASGSVTLRERELVLKMAELRGVQKDGSTWQQLTKWLDVRPSEEFFQNTLRAINYLLWALPDRERILSRTSLISFCLRIATTSGGFLGMSNRISEGEREALDQISAELTNRNPEMVRQVIEER